MVNGKSSREFEGSCLQKNSPIEKQNYELECNLRKGVQGESVPASIPISKIPAGYHSLDENGCFLAVNDTWCRMLGYHPKEVIGKWFGDLLTPESLELFRIRYPEFKSTGLLCCADYQIRHKDGYIKHVSISGNINRTDRGEFIQTHCIVTDITDKIEMLESVKTSEKKYRELFDQANDAIFVVDRNQNDGHFINVNERACELLGYTREELQALTPIDLSVDYQHEDLIRIRDKVFADGHGFFDWTLLAKNGQKIPVEMNSRIFKHQGYILEQTIARDVSTRIDSEQLVKNNEANFRELLNTSDEHIMMITLDCAIKFMNNRMAEYLSIDFEPSINTNLFTYLSEIECPHWEAAISYVLKFKKANSFELTQNDSDLVFHFKPIENLEGEFTGIAIYIKDISEIKKATELASRFGNLLDRSLNEIFIFDAETLKFLHVTQGGCYNTQYDLPELKRMTPLDLKPSLTMEAFRKMLIPLQNDSVDKVEFKSIHHRKDGSTYPVEVHFEQSEYWGKPVIVAFIIDITEREIADQRQKLTTQVLHILNKTKTQTDQIKEILMALRQTLKFDAAAVRINCKGNYPYYQTAGNFIDFNPEDISQKNAGLEQVADSNLMNCLCGYVLSEGNNCQTDIVTAKGSLWINSLRQLEEKNLLSESCYPLAPQGFESLALIPLRSGSEIIGLLQLSDHRKDKLDADLMNFLDSIGDSVAISFQKKQVENKLLKSREHWKSLYSNLPGGSFIVNRNYLIEDVNELLCKVTHYTREELIGKPCGIICPKGPHACPIFDLGKLQIDNDETAVKRRDGTRVPILKSARRFRFEDSDFIVENFQDITEYKRLEEQLLHSQKMEAIGTLAGGIAHDFNNILTIIQGHTQLAMMDLPETEPIYSDFLQINNASQRAISLVRQLMLFTRKQPVQSRQVQLNDVIREVLIMLRRIIREDILIQFDPADDLWIAEVDPDNIEQVIINLAINARDAMAQGGQLIIKTRNVDAIEIADEIKNINPKTELSLRYIEISVSDTGCGMDEEMLDRIFEPFFSTKGLGKGTGLGLSVIYGIIKQHNGYINVVTEKGKGTVFQILLPVQNIAEPDIHIQKINSQTGIRGNGEKILVVEDETSVLDYLQRLLRISGYEVVYAKSAEEACTVFDRDPLSIDLLFSDVILPDLNGFDLAEKLLIRRPDLRVLLGSGYSGNKAQVEICRKHGFIFLQKPYDQAELLESIHSLLNQNSGE